MVALDALMACLEDRQPLDRVLERGRYVPLKGPSMHTLHTRHLEGLDYES